MPQLRTFKLILLFFNCTAILYAGNESRVIPKPESIKWGDGFFEINRQTKIYIAPSDPNILETARWFVGMVANSKGFRLQIINKVIHPAESNYILFKYNSPVDTSKPEAYELQVSSGKIIIAANQPNGILYALQTIRQLLPSEFEKQSINNDLILRVPCCTILDQPAFKWRGMLLDCGRHFMSKDFIKRYIDLLSYYKMNRLHWHLTEDQGWRMEIKKYPLLTTIGSWRKEKDSSVYGGFYTQDDIHEIVQYASGKNVMIIPEIEMPGHCTAALASYPYLSCRQESLSVVNSWGVFKDVYCAGNDSVFSFLQNVLTEVCNLFPAPYIHIGGDETPKYRWENCDKCRARMNKEQLKDVHELQSYFIKRIEKFLATRNKKIIGWDEILEGGLPEGATVQSWQNLNGALKAAEQGHDAIVSPTSHAYFDYSVKAIDLEKVYSFNPIPEGMKEEEKKHILGGECNLWTEMSPQELVDSRMFPRMLAMSEVLWSESKNDYKEFLNRVRQHYSSLTNLGVKYGYEKLPVTIKSEYNFQNHSFDIFLEKGQDNVEIFYSTDGSVPTVKSHRYNRSFVITNSCEVKAIPVSSSEAFNEIYSREFAFHKALNAKVQLKNPFNDNYKATGNNSVIDGIRGATDDFRDGIWQGYWGKDFECVIDLGKEMDISKISSGYLQSNPSWIFMPQYVEYSFSNDSTNFSLLGKVINDIPMKEESMLTKDFEILTGKIKARYIKVFAKNAGKCPPWHNGAGGDAWVFIDEIVVE